MYCIENDNTSSPQILSHKKHIKQDWHQMDIFLCLIIFILLNLFRKNYSSFITYLVLLMCLCVVCLCMCVSTPRTCGSPQKAKESVVCPAAEMTGNRNLILMLGTELRYPKEQHMILTIE